VSEALVIGLAAALVMVVLSGCESTQSRSARLAAQANTKLNANGLSVRRATRQVKVRDTRVIQDGNGTAAVVVLQNRTHRPLAAVPVAIEALDARDRSVFRNDEPGLEPSLTGPAYLAPGGTIAWVNDQLLPAGTPRRLKVKVGAPRRGARRPPAIALTRARRQADPVSGIAAVGRVTNRSKVTQRDIVVYGVARRGRRIVAAGRAQIEKLPRGKRKSFQLFFIGDPRGARIELAAPPTTFK